MGMITTKHHQTIFPFALIAYEMTLYLSNDAYLPAFVNVTQDLGTTHYLTQLTLSLFCFGMLVMQFLLGFVADRYGRRQVLLTGGLLFIVSTLGCMLAPSIGVLMVARFFEGAAIPFMFVGGYGAIHELFEREQAIKLLALMGSITIMAPSLGPLLGGLILKLFDQWRFIFALLLGTGSMALCLLYFFMPETRSNALANSDHNMRELLQQYRRIITNVNFLKKNVISGLLMAMLISWIAVGPFLIIATFHYSPIMFGVCQLLVFGTMALGNHVVKWRLQESNTATFMKLAFNGIAAGAALSVMITLVFAHQLYGVIIGLAVISFFTGICFPILNRLSVESSAEPMGAKLTMQGIIVSGFVTVSTGSIGWITQGKVLPFALFLLCCALITNWLSYDKHHI